MKNGRLARSMNDVVRILASFSHLASTCTLAVPLYWYSFRETALFALIVILPLGCRCIPATVAVSSSAASP